MSELKPCPFCGAESFCYADENGIEVEHMEIKPGIIHFVMCAKCTALVSGVTEAEAIEAWNRRTNNE